MSNKDPPDKFSCIKIPIKHLQYADIKYDNLFDVIKRMHKLRTLGLQMLRLFILNQYEKNEELLEINELVVTNCLKSLCLESGGRKRGNESLAIYNKFSEFYDSNFKDLINDTEISSIIDSYLDNNDKEKVMDFIKPIFSKKIDGTNLSASMSYMVIEIVTNIENNIKVHFINRVKQYVNQIFKKQNEEILNNFKGKIKEERKKLLNKELNEIKRDLLNKTTLCNQKYHTWINEVRNKILPPECTISYNLDVTKYPQKYLKYMIFMSRDLEEKQLKQFQVFPLTTDIIMNNIYIDTSSIIDILYSDNQKVLYEKNKVLFNEVVTCRIRDRKINYVDKGTILNNIERYKCLWNSLLNIQNKNLKRKNQSFYHSLSTDGYSVSVRFINNKYLESNTKKIKTRMIKLAESRVNNKNKEKAQIIQEKEDKIKLLKIQKKEKDKKIQEEYNKLTPKEKKEQIVQKLEIKKNKKIELNMDFLDITELDKETIQEIKNKKRVYSDNGKKSLFKMISHDYDKNKKTGAKLDYTNKTRIVESKRLVFQEQREKFKKKKGIGVIEGELIGFNSKSCVVETFKKYIKQKNKVNIKLEKLYDQDLYRKLKLYSYYNTKRSEEKLLKQIEKIFGKPEDIVIIMGDWSISKQMKHFISTPNIGLKRKIASRFKVYDIDEYRTSCLNYKTGERSENMYLPDKKGKIRRMHSILTYKMEIKNFGCITERLSCINRDMNGVYNIRKLGEHYLETGEWIEEFKRGKSRTLKKETKRKKLSTPTRANNQKKGYASNDNTVEIDRQLLRFKEVIDIIGVHEECIAREYSSYESIIYDHLRLLFLENISK